MTWHHHDIHNQDCNSFHTSLLDMIAHNMDQCTQDCIYSHFQNLVSNFLTCTAHEWNHNELHSHIYIFPCNRLHSDPLDRLKQNLSLSLTFIRKELSSAKKFKISKPCSQATPMNPGAHLHCPFARSHVPPFSHRHSCSQLQIQKIN